MIDKEKLKELVEQFSQASKNKEYINSQNEANTNLQYIEPLFMDILGWQRINIVKEQRILKGRADYILKIGNEEVAVIETKKPAVSLTEEEGRQAVSYAYHRKIKFAILTNFKEIKVYHALSNIKNIDRNLLKFDDNSYFRIGFNNFLSDFDKLFLLSKESFENKEINKLLSKKDEKLSKSIDEHILNDLLKVRDWLSKELKSKKNYFSQEKIDEVVQVFINRLIFIRSVEDRGLEPMNYLKSLEADVRQQNVKLQLFPYLLEEFKKFNDKYDSKLFEPGILEKEGAFSDEVLRKVILALYFGVEGNQERYLFDQIPGDLLGSIYEQYLGTVLQGTEKRVKLESESGKRKKMGIYYTPSYIVDYIVKNTVGEYIKDKTIDEILEVNILDPACGSGSFLTRAFQEVADVIEEKLKKGEKSKTLTFQNYNGRLSLGQKANILLNCIYGVDLDEKAVELAQLNLLLKLLEDETSETKKRLLPNMKDNIKNGNSLIDDAKIAGDKAFNWHAQFPDVFRHGGFDVVVGNPPYVKIQTFSDNNQKQFLEKNFKSATSNFDLYVLFVEKGYNLLKKKGTLGFILPHKFFQAEFGIGIREFLQSNGSLKKIVDFRDNQIFDGATTYTCLLFLNKAENKILRYLEIKSLDNIQKRINESPIFSEIEINKLDSKKWIFSSSNDVLNNLSKNSDSNLENLTSAIFQGIATGADKIFFMKKVKDNSRYILVYSKALEREVQIEKDILKPLIKGNMPKRYALAETDELILFPYSLNEKNKVELISQNILKEKFPKAHDYLKHFEKELRNRENGKFDNPRWYCYSRNQGMSYIGKKKILTPDICKRGESSVDLGGIFLTTTTVYGVIPKDEKNFNFLLSILNSNILSYFIKKTGTILRGGFYRYKTKYLKPFPVKLPSPAQEQKIVSLVDQMLSLQKQLHEGKPTGNEKERLEQQIKNIDYEIDQEVYKLYGLTKKEIKIIEESLK